MPSAETSSHGLLEALSTAGWPSRALTLADWEALPEDDGYRLELAEGVVHVAPRPTLGHQRAVPALWAVLDRALTPRALAAINSEVVLRDEPVSIRVPDAVVLRREGFVNSRSRVRAADVLLVVEVVSPGTGRTDRVTKASEYAEAGIAEYWVVELEPRVTLTRMLLDDGATTYRTAGPLHGAAELDVLGVALTLDLDALV